MVVRLFVWISGIIVKQGKYLGAIGKVYSWGSPIWTVADRAVHFCRMELGSSHDGADC